MNGPVNRDNEKKGKGRAYILLLFLSLFIYACNAKTDSEIANIRIIYLPQGLTASEPINECDKIFHHQQFLKDTLISNKKFNTIMQKEISSLAKAKNQNIVLDLRIRCEIKYKNGNKTIICFGEFFNILKEGDVMIDNPTLLKLIKDMIY